MITRLCKNSRETSSVAALVAKEIHDSAPLSTATLVCLSGELGAGKTTFVQALAKTLGAGTAITSPTFVLLKSYLIHSPRFTHLIHIDAYRLHDGSQLSALDIHSLLANPKHLIVIEWPEHVESALPAHRMTIRFEHVDETTRKISID